MFVLDKSLLSHRYDFHLYIYHCYYLCFDVFRYKSNYEFNLFIFHCFHKYFPLCSKKTITEFVSCFIGSLVVKVIKNRLEALKKGAISKGVCP